MSRDTIGDNSFEREILPACDCAPRISPQFPSNSMIPIDQGGGGYTSQTAFAQPKLKPRTPDTLPVESIFHEEIHKQSARPNHRVR